MGLPENIYVLKSCFLTEFFFSQKGTFFLQPYRTHFSLPHVTYIYSPFLSAKLFTMVGQVRVSTTDRILGRRVHGKNLCLCEQNFQRNRRLSALFAEFSKILGHTLSWFKKICIHKYEYTYPTIVNSFAPRKDFGFVPLGVIIIITLWVMPL